MQPRLQGLSVAVPFFWRLSDSIDVILSDVANDFHIWLALTGYFIKELAGGFNGNYLKRLNMV